MITTTSSMLGDYNVILGMSFSECILSPYSSTSLILHFPVCNVYSLFNHENYAEDASNDCSNPDIHFGEQKEARIIEECSGCESSTKAMEYLGNQ